MAYEPFNLAGKVALVTGGNRGIGLGMARAMAQAGADIVVWGTSETQNLAAEGELTRLACVRVLVQRVDVADEAAVVAAMAEAATAMGRLDTVIANAGIGPARRRSRNDRGYLAPQHGGEPGRRLLHLPRGLQAHVERAKAGDPGGSIAVTASLAAIDGAARNEAYAATKGGVIAMMKAIAVEHARWGCAPMPFCRAG